MRKLVGLRLRESLLLLFRTNSGFRPIFLIFFDLVSYGLQVIGGFHQLDQWQLEQSCTSFQVQDLFDSPVEHFKLEVD